MNQLSNVEVNNLGNYFLNDNVPTISVKQTEIGHNLIKQRLHSDSPKTVTNVMYHIVHYRPTRGWKSHIPSGNAGNTHRITV